MTNNLGTYYLNDISATWCLNLEELFQLESEFSWLMIEITQPQLAVNTVDGK